ncbi:isopentenyl transferase family protein [Streptomyces sp. NPDC056661]|uniref:isopentenyl transferase family protein n=1 Tax=Streptomyces sp. NPDC056661 TaxID=3345898 RepID=UPI0036ADB3CB
MHQIPVVAIVGTTASGKSDLAITLAEALGGEVINADSMQLYKGLNLGAAKITPAEMRGAPHHLLDVLDLDQPSDVASFRSLARSIIDDLRSRGRTPARFNFSELTARAPAFQEEHRPRPRPQDPAGSDFTMIPGASAALVDRPPGSADRLVSPGPASPGSPCPSGRRPDSR